MLYFPIALISSHNSKLNEEAFILVVNIKNNEVHKAIKFYKRAFFLMNTASINI